MRAKELIDLLNTNELDERLLDIYVDSDILEYEKNRYKDATSKFIDKFGDVDVSVFSAPGRSEICGNHTDHQHGMVVATSVNVDTLAIVEKTDNNTITVLPDGYEMITIDLNDLDVKESEYGTTVSLIKGVVAGIKNTGFAIGGFNAYTTSDVLVGAGLSSSAAYEVLIGNIISGLYNACAIDSVEIAKISQYSENIYFGKPCGLMDQMACSVGELIFIDFANPKEPKVEKIDIDFSKYGYSLCIVDTRESHADLTDDYAAIPEEMKKVANYFGKAYLREVAEEDFYDKIYDINENISERAILRSMHFFDEEKNVCDLVEYLKTSNIDGFLKIVEKSGNSSYKYLQNIYSSKKVVNQKVALTLAMSEKILKEDGVCRVHGGGFAGTIQAFVKNEKVKEYKEKIEKSIGKDTCKVLKIRNYGGIQVV